MNVRGGCLFAHNYLSSHSSESSTSLLFECLFWRTPRLCCRYHREVFVRHRADFVHARRYAAKFLDVVIVGLSMPNFSIIHFFDQVCCCASVCRNFVCLPFFVSILCLFVFGPVDLETRLLSSDFRNLCWFFVLSVLWSHFWVLSPGEGASCFLCLVASLVRDACVCVLTTPWRLGCICVVCRNLFCGLCFELSLSVSLLCHN